MSKNPTEIVVFANEGGGGHPPRQENFRLSCQYSGFIRALKRCIDSFQCCFLALLHKFVAALLFLNLPSKSFLEIFSKFPKQRFGTSSITTNLFTPIFALLEVVDICLIRAIYVGFSSPKFLKIKSLQHFSSFLYKKMRYRSAIFQKFRDEMTTALHALLGWHNLKQNGSQYLNLQRPNNGIIMMLIVLFIPIAFFGIKYSQTLLDRRQKILGVSTETAPIYRKYDPATVALIAAKNWDPTKTLANQDLDAIYEAVYDSGIWCHKSTLGGAIAGLISDNAGEEIAAATPPFAPTTSAGKIEYAKKDITVSVNSDWIKALCNSGQTGCALPAESNLDLVLAIPTNATSALSEIKTRCSNFILDNFQHTRGVYFSLIPYSGKLSIPSSRASNWTIQFPKFSEDNTQQLLSGACLYATVGTSQTSLTTQYSWNNSACPIMFRRGSERKEAKYGNNPYHTGNLLGTTDPGSSDQSSKYLQMNLRPCTLSNASLLGMRCISDCTQFSANPNPMMEPIVDATAACNKCNSLATSGDQSNFIFAALEWTNNMLQNWTNDSPISAVNGDEKNSSATLSYPSKTTSGRKKAVILLVNKPDHFEPGEMTYLGFSDDYKEENLSTETIDFSKNLGTNPKSARGALQLSGASYDSSSGYYQCSAETSCSLACISKNLVKLIVEPISGNGELTFTNLTKNEEGAAQKSGTYVIPCREELFVEATQIADSKTIEFKAKNLRFVQAEITNRPYTKKPIQCSITRNGNTATIKTEKKAPFALNVVPDGGCYFQLEDGPWLNFTNEEPQTTTTLDDKDGSLSYIIKNATITDMWLDGQYFYNFCNINNNETETFSVSAPANGVIEVMGDQWYYNEGMSPTYDVYCNGQKILHISKGSDKTYSVFGGFTVSEAKNEDIRRIYITKGYTANSMLNFKVIIGNDGRTFEKDGLTYCKGQDVYATIKNNSRVTWGNSSGNYIYLDGNSIKFLGYGKPTVVVTPNPPKLTYTRPNNSSNQMKFFGVRTLTIDPSEYKYEDRGDGYYYITFQLDRVNITASSSFEILGAAKYTQDSTVLTINVPTKNKIMLNVVKNGIETEGRVFLLGEYAFVIADYVVSFLQEITVNCTVETCMERAYSKSRNNYRQNLSIVDECYFLPRSAYSSFPDSWKVITKETEVEFKTAVKNGGVFMSILYPTSTLTLGTVTLFFDDLQFVAYKNGRIQEAAPEGVILDTLGGNKGYCNVAYTFNSSIPVTIKLKNDINRSVNLLSYVVDFDVPPGNPVKLDFDDKKIYLPSGQVGDLRFRARPEWTVIHFAPNGTSTFEYYPEKGEHAVAIDPTKDKYEQSGDSYNVKVDIGRLSVSSVRVTQDKYSYIVEPEQSARSGVGNTVLRNATGVEDPTAAAKAATTTACSKLKQAYGDDVRIYLVKYRKSAGDYSYLDNCATSTGGKTYDVDNSTALKTTLDEIATALKSWAGYTEARVVN